MLFWSASGVRSSWSIPGTSLPLLRQYTRVITLILLIIPLRTGAGLQKETFTFRFRARTGLRLL